VPTTAAEAARPPTGLIGAVPPGPVLGDGDPDLDAAAARHDHERFEALVPQATQHVDGGDAGMAVRPTGLLAGNRAAAPGVHPGRPMPPHPTAPHPWSLPLWPLPLIAGLLPALASLLAMWLSVRAGLVPGCNPFVDGCTSISRAARHELPNHLFRAMVLPAATLQALTWVLVARWLRAEGERGAGLLATLGLVAGAALVLYGSFLGTEGAAYRLLRQYGTVLYFGLTCLAMLLAGRALERLAARGTLPIGRRLPHVMVVLFGTLVALGLLNALAGWWTVDPLKDRIQNASEWWGSLILTLVFVALSAVWRRAGLRVQVTR
jgi:hypothetical protein